VNQYREGKAEKKNWKGVKYETASLQAMEGRFTVCLLKNEPATGLHWQVKEASHSESESE